MLCYGFAPLEQIISQTHSYLIPYVYLNQRYVKEKTFLTDLFLGSSTLWARVNSESQLCRVRFSYTRDKNKEIHQSIK